MEAKPHYYWTLFKYGDGETICSKHRNFHEAVMAAEKCERRGGAPHRIVQVQEWRGYPRKKRSA